MIAIGLLVAVLAAAAVTVVVLKNNGSDTAGSATPPAATSGSTAMTGRTIGARSLPAPVPPSSSSAEASSSASKSSSGGTSESSPSTGATQTSAGSSESPRAPSVSSRPNGGSGNGPATSADNGSDPSEGSNSGGLGELAIGGCVAITEFAGEGAVSLQALDCDDPVATYLVQADGFEPCDAYELTLNSPQDDGRSLCLDFNVEKGDCLTVGADGPLGDQVQDCSDVESGGATYEVLSVQQRTSDIGDCPGGTEVALPNETRNRLVCLGKP